MKLGKNVLAAAIFNIFYAFFINTFLTQKFIVKSTIISNLFIMLITMKLGF